MSATEISNRFRYHRMVGYVTTLVMHLTNAIHMRNTFKGDALKDPDVKQFHDNELRFLTIWNVYLQIFYATLGLSCEILSITYQDNDNALLKTLKGIRDGVFSCLVCPFALASATLFWTLFSFERTLILPPSVDKMLSSIANHVIHTAIVPVVIWEMVFLPRRIPERHMKNLALLYAYASAYLIVLVSSYIQNGVWVYPILNMLDGSIYLYMFLGACVTVVILSYYLQWYLTDLIWSKIEEPKKSSKDL